MKISIITLIFISIISCTSNNQPTFQPRNSDLNSSTINLDQPYKKFSTPDSLFTNVSFVRLETTESALIQNCDKVIISGDSIFILSASNIQKAVFAFNMDGDFLFKIDARGRGPGEYLELNDFYIDTDSKHIGILDRNRLHKYDFEGNFIKTIRFSGNTHPINIEYQRGRLYAYMRNYCRTDYCNAFAVFDMEGNIIYEDLPEKTDIINFPYSKSNYLSSNTKNSYINLLSSDTIYMVTRDHLQPRFILDFGKSKLPDNEFARLISDYDLASEFFFNNDSYVRFGGVNSFNVSYDYIHLHAIKGFRSYEAIYSLRSNKTKHYQLENIPGTILAPSQIRASNGRFFFIINPLSIIRTPKLEEDFCAEGLSEFHVHNFDDRNLVTENDNPIIVFFDVLDF